MPEMMSESALDLVAQIVDQNVRDLAFTTDRLVESLERQVADLARTVVLIDEVLDDALVIDRRTEARLAELRGRIECAHDIHERADQ